MASQQRRWVFALGAATLSLGLWLTLGAFSDSDTASDLNSDKDIGSDSGRAGCDARVVQALASIKPGEGMMLGKASVSGDFNKTAKRFKLDETGPLARDYSLKMVWAPDRASALYAGANHGRPHRLNDVWEFTLCRMNWQMLYAPDNPRSYKGLGEDASDVVFADGVLRTSRGGPAVVGHTWWGLTYDASARRMLWMNTWVTDVKGETARLGYTEPVFAPGPPLWAFAPHSGAWSVPRSEGPRPRAAFGGLLVYVPELGGTVWHSNNWKSLGTWLFRADNASWTLLSFAQRGAEFAENSPEREQVAYLDKARGRIVALQRQETFEFDTQTHIWSKLETETAEASWPNGSDVYNAMYYHPKSGHGLLVEYRENTIWAFDPLERRWMIVDVSGDPMPQGKRRLAYMDEQAGVLVLINGRDVWIYRYS